MQTPRGAEVTGGGGGGGGLKVCRWSLFIQRQKSRNILHFNYILMTKTLGEKV